MRRGHNSDSHVRRCELRPFQAVEGRPRLCILTPATFGQWCTRSTGSHLFPDLSLEQALRFAHHYQINSGPTGEIRVGDRKTGTVEPTYPSVQWKHFTVSRMLRTFAALTTVCGSDYQQEHRRARSFGASGISRARSKSQVQRSVMLASFSAYRCVFNGHRRTSVGHRSSVSLR